MSLPQPPTPPSPRPGRPRLPVRVLVSPGGRSRRRSVWAIGVFGPLQLHLEPLHADLKAVHGLDGGLRAGRVVKAHEACGDRGGAAMVGHVGVLCWLQGGSPGFPGVLGAGRGVRWQGQMGPGGRAGQARTAARARSCPPLHLLLGMGRLLLTWGLLC